MLPFSAFDPERPERAVSDAPCAGSRAAADAGREEVVFVGMLVTSNRAVGEWGTVFGDAVVATAILDRLLHHSHVVTIRGDSYRLHEKRRSGLLKAPALAEGAAASARARLVQVRAQGPPTRRSARLVAVASPAPGPPYALPGQATPAPRMRQQKLEPAVQLSMTKGGSSSGRRLTKASRIPARVAPGGLTSLW